MSTPERLMGVGVTAEVAKRAGFFIQSVVGGALLKGPGNVLAYIIDTASTNSVRLDPSFDLGDVVTVFASVQTSVVPGAGEKIGILATNTNATCSVSRSFMKISSTHWVPLSSGS